MSDLTTLAAIVLYRNDANEAKARVLADNFISFEFDPHDLIVNSNVDLDRLISCVTDIQMESFTITCHMRKENDQLMLVLESGILKPLADNIFTDNIEFPITQVIHPSTEEEAMKFFYYVSVFKKSLGDKILSRLSIKRMVADMIPMIPALRIQHGSHLSYGLRLSSRIKKPPH